MAPHPLTPGQRARLLGFRTFVNGIAGPYSRIRRRGIGAPVELRRYGTGRAESLEVLHPAVRMPQRRPVVYIHGGGWICGKKELYTRDLGFLGEAGYPTFNLDYPLAPEHPHPGPLRSLLQGLAWIRSCYGEAEEVHLMGDSAGGNLVMMLGWMLHDANLRERLLPGTGSLELPRVRSIVSLYGVLDRLSWLDQRFPGAALMLHCYGGPGAFEPSVGPEGVLTPMDLESLDREAGSHPPCYLVAAGNDPLAESTRIAHEWLAREGGPSRMEIYEGEGHGFFSQPWRVESQRLRRDVLSFLAEHDPA